jgi:uncharacterized protein YyaL (SSP411 family)
LTKPKSDGRRENAENVSLWKKHRLPRLLIWILFLKWEPRIDFDKGGGHSAPKFPMPANWEYLLQYHHLLIIPKP